MTFFQLLTQGILLDLFAAFNTVDHSILLTRLEKALVLKVQFLSVLGRTSQRTFSIHVPLLQLMAFLRALFWPPFCFHYIACEVHIQEV